jgi:heterogeneous nuclear ribonucleoprotein F/H
MGGSGGNNMNNGGSSGGGGNSQYAVHLRGMPYDCGENEVQNFFGPLKLVNVQILYNNNGRHTGEADAYFATIGDAQEAMKKHKEKMGSRYIELFAKSNERRGGGGGGGGGNGNGRF